MRELDSQTLKPKLDRANDTPRSVPLSLWRGFRRRCPQCASPTLFRGYLKVSDRCAKCGTGFYHHRADDAPPYFTMLITGHVVVPIMATVMGQTDWPVGIHLAIWLPVTLLIILLLLPRIKGALIALQWALKMHGFGLNEDDLKLDDQMV